MGDRFDELAMQLGAVSEHDEFTTALADEFRRVDAEARAEAEALRGKLDDAQYNLGAEYTANARLRRERDELRERVTALEATAREVAEYVRTQLRHLPAGVFAARIHRAMDRLAATAPDAPAVVVCRCSATNDEGFQCTRVSGHEGMHRTPTLSEITAGDEAWKADDGARAESTCSTCGEGLDVCVRGTRKVGV